jgi:hypothetical protein
MPGYDRTGPLGRGPRTGGGLGECAGAGSGGLGRGEGRGASGRCRRGGVFAQGRSSARESAQGDTLLDRMRAELDQVKRQLADVLARLKG